MNVAKTLGHATMHTTLSRCLFACAAAIAIALLMAGCTSQSPESPASSSATGEASASSESHVSSTSVNSSESEDSMSTQEQVFGPLIGASYSNSGNMLGNLYRLETEIDEDGVFIVRETDSPQHDVRATIKEYRAPEGLLDRIEGIAEEAGMKGWDDLPMSEFFPLDASTPTITLIYENRDPNEYFPIRITFTKYEELPEGGDDAFHAVVDELSTCMTDENLIREYLEPELR